MSDASVRPQWKRQVRSGRKTLAIYNRKQRIEEGEQKARRWRRALRLG